MKNVFLLAAILVALSITNGYSQVVLYKSANFTGEKLEITNTWTSGGGGMPWNDAINSIKVPAGWKIMIYEHAAGNPSGLSRELTADWVADAAWRNKISNITVVSKGRTSLNVGEQLKTGEKLFSANGAYMLNMQGDDGNLCVYKAENGNQGAFVWGSMVYGFKNGYLEMQGDGNLVVYEAPRNPKWSSQTAAVFDQKWGQAAFKPVKLVLENDGKLKLYNAAGTVVWTN